MIITCETLAEFLGEIRFQMDRKGKDCVHQGTIRLASTKRPMEDVPWNKRDDVLRWLVEVHLNVVIDSGDEGVSLVQMGEVCGIDYRDGSMEKRGSDRLGEITGELESFASDHGLRVGPGIIQI